MSAKAMSLHLIVVIALASSVARAQTPPAPPPAAAAPEEPPPPVANPEPPPPPKPELSWFDRPQIVIKVGEGKSQWKLQLYGFAEFRMANDSTRSFGPGINGNLVVRDGTTPTNGQAANNGRTQFSANGSRIGIEVRAPEFGGIKSWGRIESDFSGYDPNPTGASAPAGAAAPPSEAGFFNNTTFRIRQAFLKLDSDYVELLLGQAYHVFGYQNYFFPYALGALGIPNQVFGRTQQVRLSHAFKSDAVTVEFAVGAFRPVQRDSTVPDGEAGLRLQVNDWKGLATPGAGGTNALPAAIAISGLVRRFKVDQFAAAPVGSSTDTGWAVAADALIPIIPVKNAFDRANALTLTGEFSIGSGYADHFSTTGGAGFPNVSAGPPAVPFVADIDKGLVTYDSAGILHTINWRTFQVGLQYYIPPGRLSLSVNYTQSDSSNMADLFPKSTAAITKSQYGDGNIFFDVTPAARLGVSYQYLTQQYVDGNSPHNHRVEAIAQYYF